MDGEREREGEGEREAMASDLVDWRMPSLRYLGGELIHDGLLTELHTVLLLSAFGTGK